MKLSTLKRYIEAMGGELDIVAKFASNEVHLNVHNTRPRRKRLPLSTNSI